MKCASLLTAVAATVLLALSVPAAQAAPVTQGYCSLVTQSDNLDTGDMTLNGNKADDCYGHAPKTNQGTGDLTAQLNGLIWGNDWQFVVRDEGNPSTGSFGGYNWTLDAPQGATSGSWTLTLAPATGLPITVDFVAFIKGATSGDYFLFRNETLNASNSGTFTMTFVQGGGNNAGAAGRSGSTNGGGQARGQGQQSNQSENDAGAAGLSGFSLFARNPRPVSEPGTVALIGLALAGLALVRRRRA